MFHEQILRASSIVFQTVISMIGKIENYAFLIETFLPLNIFIYCNFTMMINMIIMMITILMMITIIAKMITMITVMINMISLMITMITIITILITVITMMITNLPDPNLPFITKGYIEPFIARGNVGLFIPHSTLHPTPTLHYSGNSSI